MLEALSAYEKKRKMGTTLTYACQWELTVYFHDGHAASEAMYSVPLAFFTAVILTRNSSKSTGVTNLSKLWQCDSAPACTIQGLRLKQLNRNQPPFILFTPVLFLLRQVCLLWKRHVIRLFAPCITVPVLSSLAKRKKHHFISFGCLKIMFLLLKNTSGAVSLYPG